MSTPGASSPGTHAGAAALPSHGIPQNHGWAQLRHFAIGAVKFFWGVFFCQSIVGAILVAGWAQRAAQRAALRHWWQRSPLSHQPFEGFVQEAGELAGHAHWPNWFFRHTRAKTAPAPQGWDRAGALVTSVRSNFWLGLQAVLCTSLLLAPPGLLWWFGWDYGWNISYYKSYEQFAIGLGLSGIGIVLFVAAMFYVPMAQARQSVSGQWRAFFDFDLVWRIVRRQRVRCIGLAMACAVCALPFHALKVAPMYLSNRESGLDFPTEAAAYQYLRNYYWAMAAAGFPLFVMLRVWAARIYAGGIVALHQEQRLSVDELSAVEREVLGRLQMLRSAPAPQRHWFARLVAWALSRAGRLVTAVILISVWLGFVAQIYVGEFLNYHEWGRGWINQPLLQLPLFNYMPIASGDPGRDLGMAVAVLAVAVAGRAFIGFLQRLHRVARPPAD